MSGEMVELVLMADKLSLKKVEVESSDPHAQVIVRARAGDRAAFDQLMIQHQRRVVALAWRLLGTQDEARDAAQEAFLRVYKHLHKYDPAQDFNGWVYRIVVNVCRDQQRKRSRYGVSYEEELEAGKLAEPVSREDNEAAVLVAQERAILQKALACLSEKERQAVVLRDLEDLPTEEVARLLGSSPTTVRSQISTARVKLKAFRERWLKVRPQ